MDGRSQNQARNGERYHEQLQLGRGRYGYLAPIDNRHHARVRKQNTPNGSVKTQDNGQCDHRNEQQVEKFEVIRAVQTKDKKGDENN